MQIEIWLSSDGKHTVHVVADEANAEAALELAKKLYRPIVEEFGTKSSPQPAKNGFAKKADGVYCEVDGVEIKGFPGEGGKWISPQQIAIARKRKYGKVLCNNCLKKQETF